MKKKIVVFGSFVVDLMARAPHLPVPGETVKGSFFKQGAGGGAPVAVLGRGRASARCGYIYG